MKSTSSAFRQWFEQQYGKRPGGNRSTKRIREGLQQARWILTQAENELRARELWEERETAALRAWMAAKTDPPAPKPTHNPITSPKEVGRKGGIARAKKLTPERRKEIARKASKARWGE
jgi:hypothetical protein